MTANNHPPQQNTTTTTTTNNNNNNHHPHVGEQTIVEKMLMKDVKDRSALYQKISSRHQVQALAVIFILRIEKRPPSATSLPVNKADNHNHNHTHTHTHSHTIGGRGGLYASTKSNVTQNTVGTNEVTLAGSQHSQLNAMDPIEEINTIRRVRSTFERNNLFNGNSFQLIKYDDKRIFAMSTDPLVAMDKMIFARKLVQREFSGDNDSSHGSNKIDSDPDPDHGDAHGHAPSHAPSHDNIVSISGGCELGGLFRLTNDYYGDPVNIASKLGEDTASPGQLLVSFGGQEKKYINKFTKGATFDLGKVTVSGVEIEYYTMNETADYDLASTNYEYDLGAPGSYHASGIPESFISDTSLTTTDKEHKDQHNHKHPKSCLCRFFPCCASAPRRNSKKISEERNVVVQRGSTPNKMTMHEDERNAVANNTSTSLFTPGAVWKHLIMLQSDLSGFTRLTKKYGILHFMTLIMQCRKIFDVHLAACSGKLLKYEGDNVICKFESTDVAIQCVLKVSQDIAKYNEGKHEDFQIRVKIGMAKGLVLVTDDGDIAGDAWVECCTLGEEMGKVGEILVTEAIKNDLTDIPPHCHFEPREGKDNVPDHYNICIIDENDGASARCF